MRNSSRWTWTSARSDQVPGTTSTGAVNSDDECIIKQEAPQCSVETEDSGKAPGSPQASTDGVEEAEWSGVSTAAARAGLYDEHEVKHELVLGPEQLQPQDIAVELAVASNIADKDSVEQEPVQNVVMIDNTEESASPAQNLNNLLEQLVSTCIVRLERIPVSKQLTCQTPSKSFDLSSYISDRKRHAGKEKDMERKVHQKTKVHTKRNSYICDFCGEQFAQKKYIIEHIRITMEQNADVLLRMNSEQFKRKVIERQCPSPGDKGYASIDGAVNTKITKKPYCDICDKHFSSLNYLKKHVTKHLWKEQFVCEICKEKFSEKCHLTKHIEEAHTDQQKKQSKNVHSCEFCNKVLCDKRSLTVHKRIHTGERPFCCDVCKKQFIDKQSLLKHMRIHTGEKPFKCGFCSKKFAESGQMTTHRRTHYTGAEEKGKHTCKICQKQFISLKTHMVIHTGEKPYVCEFCGKAFSHGGTLVNHRRVHKAEEYLPCETCKRRFRLQKDLDRHKQSCTLFTCDICMKQFRRRTCLRDHQRSHTGDKPYKCDICQTSYMTSRPLVHHKKMHSEKPFTCDICKTQFRSKEIIISHIATHMEKKLYACEICQKEFAKSSQVLDHKRRIHLEKCFTCDVCKKQFWTEDMILRHKRTHTGEKPYKCEICQKPFPYPSQALTHKKIHSEKPFTCDTCKRSFKTKRKMLFHIQTHATGEKSYACEICHKTFTTYSNMLQHKKIHTEKRFTCDMCKKQFRTKHMILFHIQTHTGEKPNACKICHEPFENAGHVKTHKKLHSEKPFTCDICKMSFRTKDKILFHIRTHTE